jgi:hypothetical protein
MGTDIRATLIEELKYEKQVLKELLEKVYVVNRELVEENFSLRAELTRLTDSKR